MPPKRKIISPGKIEKPNTSEGRKKATEQKDQSCEDESNKFEMELEWCVHQLELGLCNQKPDSRQAQEAIKVLKILRSEKAPLVKKRQAMRNTFGDYRQKMKEEEKKSTNRMKKTKLTAAPSESYKSVFYKKSLKSADKDYVAMMASVKVEGQSSENEPIMSQTETKQNTCSYTFGFPDPSSSSTNQSDNGIVSCDHENKMDDVTCEFQSKQDQKGHVFVMQKSDNSFRFNFDNTM